MPRNGVCSMIAPRLKLERHRTEMLHHSSLGSCRGSAPCIGNLRRLPLVRVMLEPIPDCTPGGGTPAEERHAAGRRSQPD